MAPVSYDPLRGRYLAVRPEATQVLKPDGMPERMAQFGQTLVPRRSPKA